MKKLLLLFLIAGCAKTPIYKTDRNVTVSFQHVGVGTSANDHTGDPLRTAFIKQNSNWTLAENTFGNIYTESQTRNVINDTIEDRIDKAAPINTVAPIWADTIIYVATKSDLQNIIGSGGGGKFYYLSGITDVEGYPEAGDSTITHTDFIGKYVLFFREGNFQQRHPNNTQTDGYWFNNTLGRLTVKPIFAANEQIYVMATNTIVFQHLIAEGEGGSPPVTPSLLLDSLIAVWEFDETAGTNFNEEVGDFDGTGYNTTPNQPGKLGVSVKVGYKGAVVVPYASGLAVQADRLSLSAWFKLDTLPSVSGRTNRLITLWDNTHHITHALYVDTDNKVWGETVNTTDVVYYVTSAATVSVGTWYNAVFVCEGTGRTIKLYTNGTQAAGNSFSGTLHTFDGNITFGNQQNTYEHSFSGVIDQVVYWYQRLVPADIILLYNSGTGRAYPFN